MQTNALPDLSALLKLARQPVSDRGAIYRIALLADTASQLLAGSLRGMMRHLGEDLDLFEGEFDQLELQILDPHSALHRFEPRNVLLYLSAERIAARYGMLSVAERARFAVEFIERIARLHEVLASRRYQTIVINLADPGDRVFGHFGSKVAWSLQHQIRVCNLELDKLAQRHADLHVLDLAAIQATHGRAACFNPQLYVTSKIAISPQVLPIVSRDLCQMLIALKGGGIKCVILDLDNTLWGGVIGDDGLERIQIGDLGVGAAFTALQSWLKQLRDRGVVLAVCSKNNDAVAREAFISHPDMVLSLDDIAVFVANWSDKATNIRHIKSIVDVDFGAMMFIDDNPAERALVRESFPTMRVPELPEDPAEYLPYLQSLNAFETGSYTAEDAARTADYQAETSRREERQNFVDLDEFLKSLDMRARVTGFLPFNIPRIAQLTQRSNQFNLRTVRHTEQQIRDIATSSRHVSFAFELKDRFGDSGLISVVILEERGDGELFIDTWLMSCRVLGRGMESFVLNTIMADAKRRGCGRVVGEYIPTAKNSMVADHYRKLGFAECGGGLWVLESAGFQARPIHIAFDESL